ncbi:MAG: hypothetical protein OXN89_10700 [Bryobacterales bacterium]|nr:hypothetical protein [Bryobacterales bacterium]
MRDKKTDQALQRLVAWTERNKCSARLSQLVADYFEQVPLDNAYIFDSLKGIINAPAIVKEFILADFFTARFGENGEWNVVDDYLNKRGWRESARSRRYLESLRDASASLFQIVEVDPGQNVKVRDMLLRGKAVTVWDRRISTGLGPRDRIAAHVVTVGGERYFTGSILPYRIDLAKRAEAEIQVLAKKARKRRRTSLRSRRGSRRQRRRGKTRRAVPRMSRKEILRSVQYTRVLLKFWVMDIVEQHNAPMPELRNSDDEVMVLCQIRFPIKGDQARVAALMNEIAGFQQLSRGETEWVWSALGSPSQRFTRGEGKTAPATEAGSFAKTLGDVQIKDGVLTLRVNSAQRAERGRSLLSTQLGSLLGSQQTSECSEPLTPPEVPHPKEVSQGIHQLVDEHYRQLLDKPIAKLGGATVREAVRTKKGRRDAMDWVKEIDIAEYDRAVDLQFEPYDTHWIWKELGLEPPF